MKAVSVFCAITKPDSSLRRSHAKLSAFLISKKRPKPCMTGNPISDGPADPATGYEDQDLSERMRHGLTVDRQASNSMSWHTRQMWKAMGSKNHSLLFDSATPYRYSRGLHWWTKRQANAKLAGKTNIHKQMLMGCYAVMLDLLADRQPTVKDWNMLTGKGDRQTRREREYLPHLVHNYDGIYRLELRKPDGTSTFIPPKDARKSSGGKRVRKITTNYSLPRTGRYGFDLKSFTDPAYVARQRAFWEDALKGLSRWMEGGNAVRKGDEWLVRHMVNNDIAMHVIFDNLSLECETRWFEGLSAETQFEIAGGFFEMPPRAKSETGAGRNEAVNSTRATADTRPGGSRANRKGDKGGRPPSAREEERARFTLRAISVTDRTRFYVPPALTDEDAAKAVDELAAFAADFEAKVPENLRVYMIGRDKMDCRVRDLILEAIAVLGLGSFAEERSAAEAMILRFHGRFRRPRPGPGSRPVTG